MKKIYVLALIILLTCVLLPSIGCSRQTAGPGENTATPTPGVSPVVSPATPGTTPSCPPSQAPGDVKQVIEGNNQFTFDMFRQLAEENKGKNLFFSPYSITTAMGMAYAGAEGESEKEMATTMHFTLAQDALHQAMGQLVKDLNANASPDGYQLNVANRIWIEKTYTPKETFTNRIKTYYGLEPALGDFRNNFEGERKTINDWVEEKTNNKITNLIPAGGISSETKSVLVNAIYFFGNWAAKFDEKATKDDMFTTLDGKKIKVPFMNQRQKYAYMETEDYQAVLLPYKQGKCQPVAMLVFLPKKVDGLPELEKKINVDEINRIASGAESQDVILSLPKFKMESAFSLSSTFQNMGLQAPFVAGIGKGLSGIGKDLLISEIYHKAFVDVNEKGTEAAAATAIVVDRGAPSVEKPLTFRADHPFLFFIISTGENTPNILFMGRMMEPGK